MKNCTFSSITSKNAKNNPNSLKSLASSQKSSTFNFPRTLYSDCFMIKSFRFITSKHIIKFTKNFSSHTTIQKTLYCSQSLKWSKTASKCSSLKINKIAKRLGFGFSKLILNSLQFKLKDYRRFMISREISRKCWLYKTFQRTSFS